MSDSSSYRLEAPRPRPPPPPLHVHNSPFISSSVLGTNQNTQTLLYDLPSTTSMSPPPSSPRSKRLTSPTSPSIAGRSKGLRGGRPTPPPTARNRSTTPLGVAPSELEKFAEHCRAWYYNQDDDSGRLMTQTLTHLPPSQRAPFARLQASIRSAYHANINARRTAEFRAHLAATQPGGSLMPHSRSNPGGAVAKKERYDRLDRFVRTWCTMGMPGTRPFFEALWAVMRLQVVPENIGGAGGNRIDWEFDDGVFKEAAGKDFMLEAIDVLKGVLAFEEVRSTSRSSVSNHFETYAEVPRPHSRTQSQPLPSNDKPLVISTTVQPKRARAPSDPFLDTPALSRSLASTSSQSSGNTTALLPSLASQGADEPPSPITPPPDTNDCSHGEFASDSEEDYLRIWTSPDLPNPEYLSLLNVFPSFITRRPLPRFPVSPRNRRPTDIEEGDEEGAEARQIRFGTGTMWVSSKGRSDGWEGGWWARFILWWRKIFC